MEHCIEKLCESKKKNPDSRSRHQNHEFSNIIKRMVVPAHRDHPICSSPSWILLSCNTYTVLFIICIIYYLHCSIPSKASRKPHRSIFMFGWLVLHLHKNICLAAWNLDFSTEMHKKQEINLIFLLSHSKSIKFLNNQLTIIKYEVSNTKNVFKLHSVCQISESSSEFYWSPK